MFIMFPSGYYGYFIGNGTIPANTYIDGAIPAIEIDTVDVGAGPDPHRRQFAADKPDIEFFL
jgi:hypothetical protein